MRQKAIQSGALRTIIRRCLKKNQSEALQHRAKATELAKEAVDIHEAAKSHPLTTDERVREMEHFIAVAKKSYDEITTKNHVFEFWTLILPQFQRNL